MMSETSSNYNKNFTFFDFKSIKSGVESPSHSLYIQKAHNYLILRCATYYARTLYLKFGTTSKFIYFYVSFRIVKDVRYGCCDDRVDGDGAAVQTSSPLFICHLR